MSRIRANNIVNGAGTGAPTFPNGAIISGIATINADIDSNSNLTANQITSLQSIGVGTGATVTNPVDNELAFNTNGSERLRIDSSGNIGINNNNPLYVMHFKNAMTSTPSYIHMEVTGSNAVGGGGGIQFDTSATNSGSNNGLFLAQISGERSASDNGSNTLVFKTSRSSATGDDGNPSTPKTRMTIDENGNVTINDGNLVIGTSGHGIDFSATSDATGMTSELLDDYEEGTFTMTLSAGGNTDDQQCRYTKIGRVVYIDGHGNSELSNYFNTGSQNVDTAVTITSNLPFTPAKTGAAPITVSRTLKGANGFLHERMYVGWRSDSATIYLGSEANEYYPLNNVVTSSTQTNKTLLFSGFFFIE